ncbi:hypothetical protein N0752_03050 [Pseudomonas aeruginosa]|nr:hypothetical protein [Pseudomonas aeruginosa]MCS8825072.1 hypothetical protein [Pseudomonas aeruginosa]MCS8874285.1 hypothetical protein [Pseudomonas aeruginosa]MCS8904020.1 hypothetical protein [Pseudomonas aeruginosa]MCS8910058.1 hypothetical protein [Pseudomonas aeruginosa]
MKPMIQAHLVERDQFGFWTHPNYPDLADNCSSNEAQETLRRLGLELQTVFMESDIWPWLEPGQKLYTTPVAQAQHCAVLDAEKLIAQLKDCASHAGDPERAAAFNDAISEVHAMLAAGSSQAKPGTDDGQGGRP